MVGLNNIGPRLKHWKTACARAAWMAKERMPHDLWMATLVASEEPISAVVPAPLVGKVDQLYQTTMGGLLLVDSKQREQRRIFWRDIVQLSTYRVILLNTDDERFAGLPVLPRAYVRIAGTRGVEYVPVGLLDTEQVMALWFEHWRRQAA